jgi:hypothetical protein
VDLNLYFRVIWRFKWLVLVGLLLACALTFFAVARVNFSNRSVSYRQGQTYQAEERLYLNTHGGVPFRTTTAKVDPKTGNIYYPPNLVPPTSLGPTAILYAQLANSDLLKDVARRLPGKYLASPVATNGNPPVNLPFLAIDGFASTPEKAIRTANGISEAFISYVANNQVLAKVPLAQRVALTVTTKATSAKVSAGRHFTGPIIIFLVVLIATLGLAFLLENLRPAAPSDRAGGNNGDSPQTPHPSTSEVGGDRPAWWSRQAPAAEPKTPV